MLGIKLKLAAISFVIGGLVMATVMASKWSLGSSKGTTRMMSLGTAKFMVPRKGESKVLLNDPSVLKNWGLMGTGGQSDIRADAAWAITTGNRQVIAAIVDTGVDTTHPDLANNVWVNPGEIGIDEQGRDKKTNNIDDDKNGYTDDVNGWDFVNNKAIIIDNHGHGTHIAGIIGAVGGNGIGLSGVCPKISLMALKYYDPTSKGNDNLKNTVRAIRYAVKMGAQIINYSGGGTEPDDDEFDAIKFARDNGVLFVAAAGNERSNSDVAPYYPADYSLDNIISVTAINAVAQVLPSSNYGVRSVHIAAPGENIYSTLPNGQFGQMTGTSQATAFVSGVAALILSHNNEFNYVQVKRQIMSTADEMTELRGKTATSGKLNSYAALAIQPNVAMTGINSVGNVNNSIGVISSAREQGDNGPNAGMLTDLVQALRASTKLSQQQPPPEPTRKGAGEKSRL